jgi:hypothetical protein
VLEASRPEPSGITKAASISTHFTDASAHDFCEFDHCILLRVLTSCIEAEGAELLLHLNDHDLRRIPLRGVLQRQAERNNEVVPSVTAFKAPVQKRRLRESCAALVKRCNGLDQKDVRIGCAELRV